MTEQEKRFLADIASEEAKTRFAAWRGAAEMSPEVIAPLARLMGSDKPGVVKAATEALRTLTHARREQATRPLAALLAPAFPPNARREALALLSLVGGDDAVAPAEKWIHDPQLGEDAVYCLERIPGQAPTSALVRACKSAREDFKPRLLAALGHRRAGEAASLCVEAMKSADKTLALAGLKAFARIGVRPAGPFKLPDFASLDSTGQAAYLDSCLRYADAQAARGNHAEACKMYRLALEREEEHWQAAAIVGIAKMATPEAAATIFGKLNSPNRKVRLTARQAWTRMAQEAGPSA